MSNATRREFLRTAAATGAASQLAGLSAFAAPEKKQPSPLYKISLAEYSLHRMLAKKELDHLDFAQVTKKKFGLDAAEYWNRPWFTKAEDKKYLADMKLRADDAGVKSLLIMVDGEGNLGDPDEEKRKKAVENHHKWVEAAKLLGCHSIRVNAHSRGSYAEQLKLVTDGLAQLSTFAKDHGINVIVENHGGLSSNGAWLAAVMKRVDMPNCGTLPDFGNFGSYDRYQGVKVLMPFAKAVSAKSQVFDRDGNEARTDYHKMMKIVTAAGYHGYVGIEYAGKQKSEPAGVMATKELLLKVRDKLSQGA